MLAFGSAAAPFDLPRSVVHNNAIFAESAQLKYYFEHVRPAAASSSSRNSTAARERLQLLPATDHFEAIGAASRLTFRPGAARAFVLLPCSAAHAHDQQLDYSSVLQQLREDGVQLHVLMDQEFRSDKRRLRQSVFGIDRRHAYTKHSLAQKNGGGGVGGSSGGSAGSAGGIEAAVELRQQIGLPKAELGLCAALAMESTGTIFTASRLRAAAANPVKKFVEVFGWRVATAAAAAARCQTCECTGHNSGMAYMTCTACHRPSGATMALGAGDRSRPDGGDGGGEAGGWSSLSEEDYDVLGEDDGEDE